MADETNKPTTAPTQQTPITPETKQDDAIIDTNLLVKENQHLKNQLAQIQKQQEYQSAFSNIRPQYQNIVQKLSETTDISDLSAQLQKEHPEFYKTETTDTPATLQNEIANDIHNLNFAKQKEANTAKPKIEADPEKMAYLKKYRKKWGL